MPIDPAPADRAAQALLATVAELAGVPIDRERLGARDRRATRNRHLLIATLVYAQGPARNAAAIGRAVCRHKWSVAYALRRVQMDPELEGLARFLASRITEGAA